MLRLAHIVIQFGVEAVDLYLQQKKNTGKIISRRSRVAKRNRISRNARSHRQISSHEQIFSSLEFRFRHISRPTTSHTFVPSCCPLPLFYLSSRDRLAIINVLRRQLSVLSHLIKRRARRVKYQVSFFLEIYIMPCEVISNVEQSINFDETILEILIVYKYPKSLSSYPIKI